MRFRPVSIRIGGLPAVLVLSAALALAGAGCGSSPSQDKAATTPPVSGVHDVEARSLRFSPPAIQVPAGTTVSWHFDDGAVPHNVTGKGFASPNLKQTTWSHRFAAAGAFTYRCTLHANMVGRVVVTAQ
ncbi:MAG TPA: plastocyanin/azurin family copper-binding protein [Actinomycetota bacterium]